MGRQDMKTDTSTYESSCATLAYGRASLDTQMWKRHGACVDMDMETLYEIYVYADMYFCPMGAQVFSMNSPSYGQGVLDGNCRFST